MASGGTAEGRRPTTREGRGDGQWEAGVPGPRASGSRVPWVDAWWESGDPSSYQLPKALQLETHSPSLVHVQSSTSGLAMLLRPILNLHPSNLSLRALRSALGIVCMFRYAYMILLCIPDWPETHYVDQVKCPAVVCRAGPEAQAPSTPAHCSVPPCSTPSSRNSPDCWTCCSCSCFQSCMSEDVVSDTSPSSSQGYATGGCSQPPGSSPGG